MKSIIATFLIFFIIASGCLETIVTEKVPVLYLNLSIDENPDGSMIIKEISARGDEIPKLESPEGEYPQDFPAFFVSVTQDMQKVSYPSGKDYKGPGNYHFTLGFKPEFNKSLPLAISARGVDKEGNYTVMQFFAMNWSTDIKSTTFKYD